MRRETINNELRYNIGMTAIINKLISLFSKKKPVYGPKIFMQRSWLERQIDDAIYEREMLRGVNLPRK